MVDGWWDHGHVGDRVNRIRAWHEALGTLDKDLLIVAGQDTTVNFDVGR